MSKIIKKIDLATAIHNKIGYTKSFSENFVDSLLSTMKEEMKKNHEVKIHGFGNFVVKHKKERKGRNPQTNESIIIPARQVVTFHISQSLRQLFKEK